MKLTVKQLNKFIIFNLPSAFLCGVRLFALTDTQCKTRVALNWMNKNPFKSIYFAVLAMAAELSTGALILRKTGATGKKISTLVVGMNAEYYKKAVGKIVFVCDTSTELDRHIEQAIATKEGVSFTLVSKGFDSKGDEVAKFEFQWSIKTKESLS